MLSATLVSVIIVAVHGQETPSVNEAKPVKPYMFPIPFELPNRNDKSEQCYIRIEDVDITNTLTVKCYIAHAFLRAYIHEYNDKKMREDDVNVSLWNERRRNEEDKLPNIPNDNPNAVKDWKMTTVLDPIMQMRIYVSQKSDCRLVMYSREGMTNYKVDCAPFLYFVNDRISGAVFLQGKNMLVTVCLFLVFITNRIAN